MWGFVEARFGDGRRTRRWRALMWTGFGLAFLAKGPPGLVPLLAVISFELLAPSTDAQGRRKPVFQWWSLPLFAAIAMPLYAVAVTRNPGLLHYFIGPDVLTIGRTSCRERVCHFGYIQGVA